MRSFERNECESKENTKMNFLVPGKYYYVKVYKAISMNDFSDELTYEKHQYLGECGYNNSLLLFKRILNNLNNKDVSYNVTFHKQDYISGELKVISTEDYFRRKKIEMDKIEQYKLDLKKRLDKK